MRNLGTAFCLAFATARLAAAQTEAQPAKLTGVKKTVVIVEINANTMAAGLDTVRLRTITELKLRQFGMQILTKKESFADSTEIPWLYASVIAVPVNRETVTIAYSYYCRIEMLEGALSRRTRRSLLGQVWDDAMLGYVPSADVVSDMEGTVNRLLDEFLNDWLKANPKR